MKTILFIILFCIHSSLYSQEIPFIFEKPEIGCEVDTTNENLFNVIKSSILYLNAKCSYYAHFFHGRKTASGKKFNMYDLTCAHKTLPFGTLLRVTNLLNNMSVIVMVTDRGPYIAGRMLDISYGAAKKINITKKGIANCKVEVIKLGENRVNKT